MKTTTPYTRREFFASSGRALGLLAFSQWAPAFLTQSALAGAPKAEKDRTILVLVQLAGGNDGLNTCIPYEDPEYYRRRPTLAIHQGDVLKVSDQIGLHRACSPLHNLLREGKLAIVQNVGYPNPNRSHFRSSEIWETASDSDRYSATGWLGRYFDNTCAGSPACQGPAGIHIGNDTPQAFLAAKPHPVHGVDAGGGRTRQDAETLALLESLTGDASPRTANGRFLQHTMMNALATDRRVQDILEKHKPGPGYPSNRFARSLAAIASLIAGGMETRVYFATLGGFDTHSNQAGTHASLLTTLAEGLHAFQRDLERLKLDDQVITMTFSEFGRRPAENDSAGTDHGTAAPLFVLGPRLKGGLFGDPPSLEIEDNADIRYATDFRQVYATILDRWLESDSASVLGRRFEPVPFL